MTEGSQAIDGRRTVALVSVVTALLMAPTAQADGPEISVQPIGPAPFFDPTVCDFPLTGTLEGTAIAIRFADGTFKVIMQRTITLSVNGKTAVVRGTIVTFADLSEPGIVTRAGTTANIVIPGEGTLLLDAGLIVRDRFTGEIFFEGGPHEYFHHETADVCAYFADP